MSWQSIVQAIAPVANILNVPVIGVGYYFPVKLYREWSKKVLVSTCWISAVSWPQKAVYVNLTQDEVKSAPEWIPDASSGR